MSRPRFLVDHDLNEHIIVGVQRRESAIEFSRARDIRMSNSSDAEILEYADWHGLIVEPRSVKEFNATEPYAPRGRNTRES